VCVNLCVLSTREDCWRTKPAERTAPKSLLVGGEFPAEGTLQLSRMLKFLEISDWTKTEASERQRAAAMREINN